MTIFSEVLEMATKAVSNVQQRPSYGAGAGLSAVSLGMSGMPAMNRRQQAQAYSQVSWLYAVISRISEAVAATEWKLFQIRPNGERDQIFDHPLLDIWNTPNPFIELDEHMEITQMFIELNGEAFWIIYPGSGGKPAEIWPINPDFVEPIPHAQDFLSGYKYRMGKDTWIIPTENMIHIKKPSPQNIYRGASIIQALAPDLDSERLAAIYNKNFFNNSAEPGGIIELDAALSEEEFERMRRQWADSHKGVANAHRVALLERGKWVERKTTQREMQFSQGRLLTRDIIIGAFGVPKSVIGITDDINRATAEAGELVFGRWVLRPRLRRIRGATNARLVKPHYGDNLFLDFVDPVPQDKEHNLNEADKGYAGGWLTLNETRRRVGEDAVDGGDDFRAPAASPFALAFNPNKSRRRSIWPVSLKAKEQELSDLDKAEALVRDNWAERLNAELAALTAFIADLLKSLWRTSKASTYIVKIELSDLTGYDWDWWNKYSEDVIDELSDLFEISLTDATPNIEPSLARLHAMEYAETRGAQLLRLDGDLNLANFTRQRVNVLVANNIEKGESLQTLQKALREDVAFSAERARTVARTETATALGQGGREAALIDGRNEKHWRTQGDDRVSQTICAPNERAGWVKIINPFVSGHETVPGHPNCRCTVSYRTVDALGLAGIFEHRCDTCSKLLLVNPEITLGRLWCPRCKTKVHLSISSKRVY